MKIRMSFPGCQQQQGGAMEEEIHGIVIVGGGICGLATALALHR
jgi:NADH dehydrogenase FAD-containing subunit